MIATHPKAAGTVEERRRRTGMETSGMKLRQLIACGIALMAAPVLWAQAAVNTSTVKDGPDPAQVADLVVADHILANEGVLDAWGHVSVRDARNPNHFLLSRAVAPGLVTAADIVEYDLDSKPVKDTAAVGYLERFIHGEIYKARPDVMAIIHSHAAEVIPFSVTAVPLRPMIHMAGFMPQMVPVFEIRNVAGMTTDMLIESNELGHALAQTLGDDSMVLLRGHGAVVVGPSLHATVGRAYYMVVDAKTELQAIAIGGGKVTYLTPEEADKTSTQGGFERGWEYWKSKLQK
jgi:ribulose-5-phosphate 4-epimerase/fuculose-1-phosphate aldolase